MTEPRDNAGRDQARRQFLKWVGLAGAAALVAATVPAFLVRDVEDVQGVPPRRRRWTMLIDLRRCDGCGVCEVACQKEHHVPDGQEWIRVYSLTSAGGVFYLPRPCMHCDNAPCLKVCPVGATFRSADGLVLIDPSRCIGCRYCMAACPYDARMFNWSEPEMTAHGADLSPDLSRGTRDHRRGVVEKCMFCAHRLDGGRLPACVEACPMKAIYFGDANEDFLSNGSETVRLSTVLSTQQAFRYKEDLGTEPRVYYLPVRR